MPNRDRKIWIEVDDFIRTFDWAITPVGIGRVQMELIPRLAALYPERVGLCRIGQAPSTAEAVDAATLERLIDRAHYGFGSGPARHLATRALQTGRYMARFAAEALGGHARARRVSRFADAAGPDDMLLALGASWEHRDYATAVRALKQTQGLRFALLVHDVLPVSHPRFVSSEHVPNFVRWLTGMTGIWDRVLTPSHASARFLGDWLDGHGLTHPPITPVRFGAGIRPTRNRAADRPVETEPYVLLVSTIEVRKNHMLAFRVWRELLERHGPDKVPKLVFAGKMGWDVDDLRQALADTACLGGKIRVVEGLTDAEISRAYRDCLFTFFPSYCEGWGLPVTESLAHGKLCIASDATSIPEAGGSFCAYFDPDDAEAATALVERALFETDWLGAREAQIAARYERPTWDDCARQIVTLLDSDIA